MAKFVYLIGAGASAKALPVVDQIPNVFNEIFKHMKSHKYRQSENFKVLDKDLRWLYEECLRHASVDTLAKKLFLSKRTSELNKLKALLSAVFIYIENKQNLDPRYDSFFASILLVDKEKIVPPSNLKVISWNYDSQFESSFSEFIDSDDPYEISTRLDIWPISKKDQEMNRTIKPFSLYKLNGTARVGFRGKELQNIMPQRFNFSKIDIRLAISQSVEAYKEIGEKKIRPTLTFAWEDEASKTLEQVKNSVTNTEYLIVIGYSFPTFNRVVDSMILNQMRYLKKVYIQDPNHRPVEQRLNAILGNRAKDGVNKISIEPIPETDEFFIPFEYNLPH